jgi:hypothetical protein
MVRWSRSVSLLAVMIVCGAVSAEDGTTLRYKFKTGDKLHYMVEQKMNMEVAAGQAAGITMTQTIDISWDIKSVDKDGTAKMTQTFDRMRFDMTAPNVKVEYDSKTGKLPDGPVGQILGPLFQAMTGAEFDVTMDVHGKVLDVKIPEKFTEALKKTPAAAAMGDMFSPEGMKRMITQSGVVLPEGPITKGKSWDQKVDMKMPFGKMDMLNQLTFEGMTQHGNEQVAEIALRPKFTFEADPNSPFKLKVKSQEAKGKAYFDLGAGRLVETTLDQTMEMEANNMTQKLEQKVTMKLQDKESGK